MFLKFISPILFPSFLQLVLGKTFRLMHLAIIGEWSKSTPPRLINNLLEPLPHFVRTQTPTIK